MLSRSSMDKPTIVLIDADGVLFAAALKGETKCSDGERMQMLDSSAIYRDCVARLREQAGWVKGDTQVFIVLSDRRNFRYSILPTYKGNRGGDRPLALDQLRKDIVEKRPFPVLLIEGIEADDTCGISAGKFQEDGYRTVVISPDKDLLSIPGELITPVRDPKVVKVHHVVTEEAADRWHLTQTLMGDVTDNYKGCPGWGARKAGSLLDELDEEGASPAERWRAVVEAFEKKGLTEADALVQARVARILRWSDWDEVSKEPILWVPPVDVIEQRKVA